MLLLQHMNSLVRAALCPNCGEADIVQVANSICIAYIQECEQGNGHHSGYRSILMPSRSQ